MVCRMMIAEPARVCSEDGAILTKLALLSRNVHALPDLLL